MLAHGQRLGQGGQVGGQRVGHGEQQHLLEHHVLGQGARVGVGVADLLHAARSDDDGHRADPGADREGAGGVGTVGHHLGAELVAEDAVGPGSRAGTPTQSMSPVKCAKSASACRSEPQMPAASERTTTWPGGGTGSATRPTTSPAPGHRCPHACPPVGTDRRSHGSSLRLPGEFHTGAGSSPVRPATRSGAAPVPPERSTGNRSAMPVLEPRHDLAHPVEGDAAWSES